MYSLTLPLKSSITLVDAAVLIAIFVVYTIRISRAPAEEPHLVGPATLLAAMRPSARRTGVVLFFLFAAATILLVAEHFADALVETGASFDISEFLLVQWLAPLASEAPELLVAGLFAWRLNANAGLGMLVSSKVNQWTLLVGTLPIAFALAAGSIDGLPIIARQREELLLTAAQSVFAIAILLNLKMTNKETMALFGLFWGQFLLGALVPERWHGTERIAVSVVYILMGLVIVVRQRGELVRRFRDGFRTPYAHMDER
jgi:cation:H+ antiporter